MLLAFSADTVVEGDQPCSQTDYPIIEEKHSFKGHISSHNPETAANRDKVCRNIEIYKKTSTHLRGEWIGELQRPKLHYSNSE